MSIVLLASAKGSPGATTTALALGSWWPRPVIVIEADPAGGDLAARLGMSEEPGLVGLAAALRRNSQHQPQNGDPFAEHTQQTSAGVRVVVAPAGSQQATSALNLLSNAVPPTLPDRADLLVDIGRLSGPRGTFDQLNSDRQLTGWTRGILSDLLIWICRPQLDDLAHLAAALHQRRDEDLRQVIVLCGAGPYPVDEVAGTFGLPVYGHLPVDPSGAAALWMGGGRTWPRSALGRATKSLVDAIGAVINLDGDEDLKVEPEAVATPPEAHDFLVPESPRGLV